jgi:hypothetical protein
MPIQFCKMTITILMIATLFCKATFAVLCVGAQSGNVGFCIDLSDQNAVNTCTNNGFTMEADTISGCGNVCSSFFNNIFLIQNNSLVVYRMWMAMGQAEILTFAQASPLVMTRGFASMATAMDRLRYVSNFS